MFQRLQNQAKTGASITDKQTSVNTPPRHIDKYQREPDAAAEIYRAHRQQDTAGERDVEAQNADECFVRQTGIDTNVGEGRNSPRHQ
jgi:hypothetical protein